MTPARALDRTTWPPMVSPASAKPTTYEPAYAFARDGFASGTKELSEKSRAAVTTPATTTRARGVARELDPDGCWRGSQREWEVSVDARGRVDAAKGRAEGIESGTRARLDAPTRDADLGRDASAVALGYLPSTQLSRDVGAFCPSGGDIAREWPSQSEREQRAMFDRRAMDERINHLSGSTPTLEASAPSALRAPSHDILRAFYPSQEMAVPKEREETIPSMASTRMLESRVAQLECDRGVLHDEVNGVKRILSDIMSTQAHLLSTMTQTRARDATDARFELVRRRVVSERADSGLRRRRHRDNAGNSPKPRRACRDDERTAAVSDDDGFTNLGASQDDVEVSESQLKKIVLSRMLSHQRGVKRTSVSDSE